MSIKKGGQKKRLVSLETRRLKVEIDLLFTHSDFRNYELNFSVLWNHEGRGGPPLPYCVFFKKSISKMLGFDQTLSN